MVVPGAGDAKGNARTYSGLLCPNGSIRINQSALITPAIIRSAQPKSVRTLSTVTCVAMGLGLRILGQLTT